jgi:hypothetical protein
MRVYVEEMQNGRYRAKCDAIEITARQPFFEMARRLSALDVHPDTELTMWRKGDETWSLRSTVGAAAKLTVMEGEKRGPEFRSYVPFSRVSVSRPAAENEF